MADVRPYAGGHFALDIMGANAGFLKRFDGFDMQADVVTNGPGPESLQKKHIANVRWTPGKATVGLEMGKEMYHVIQQALAAEPAPFDGALIVGDSNYKIQSSLNFTGATLTAITFPKLDGSSKEAAFFDLEWEAETVRWRKGDGSDMRRPAAPARKVWLRSNFHFEMGSLPCSRVATIDSFTWRRTLVPTPIGGPSSSQAMVTVPNIAVEISMADHDAWLEAATKWFVDGNHGEKDEMSGAIVFLGPDMKAEIGRLTLGNCGFAKFSHGVFDANSDKAARFSCELYVEHVEFTLAEYDA